MLRKLSLLLLIGLFLAGFAYAQDKTKTPDNSATASQNDTMAGNPTDTSKNTQVTGTIDRVSLDAHTITLKDPATAESKDYTFNQSTAFKMKNKALKASELKVGDTITLDLDANNVATKGTVTARGPEHSESNQQKH